MFPQVKSGITLSKVLTGVSKGINIAQQFVPLLEKTPPIINGVKKFLNKSVNSKTQSISQNKKTTTSSNSFNSPSFFK